MSLQLLVHRVVHLEKKCHRYFRRASFGQCRIVVILGSLVAFLTFLPFIIMGSFSVDDICRLEFVMPARPSPVRFCCQSQHALYRRNDHGFILLPCQYAHHRIAT